MRQTGCLLRRCSSAEFKVDMTLVKKLRDTHGYGVKDCRDAVFDAKNDYGKAISLIKERSRLKARKKLERVAADGLIQVLVSPSFEDASEAAVVEMNSETDFVPRLPAFQDLLKASAHLSLDSPTAQMWLKSSHFNGGAISVPVSTLLEAIVPERFTKDKSKERLDNSILDAVGVIGECIKLRRSAILSTSAEKSHLLGAFTHGGETGEGETTEDSNYPGLKGTNCVLLVAKIADSSIPRKHQQQLVHLLARHVGLSRKFSFSPSVVPTEGSSDTHLNERQLKEEFLGDNDNSESNLVLEKWLVQNGVLSIVSYLKWRVGEGIEKNTTNFADEVKKTVEKASRFSASPSS